MKTISTKRNMWKYIVIWLVGTWVTVPCTYISEKAGDYYMASSHHNSCEYVHGVYEYQEFRKEFKDRKVAIKYINDAPIEHPFAYGFQYLKDFKIDSVWVDNG